MNMPARARRKKEVCPYCGKETSFCWRCRCGFHMCQSCMDENLWGMTCNNITWECPDCGRVNVY